MISSKILGVGALLWLCASPVAHAADCPAPNTPDQIKKRFDRAQSAFQELDIDTFTFSMEEVGLMIPCLDRRPTRAFSAELHRLQAVSLYASDKPGTASTSLRAGKALEPDYAFPKDMFPEGYALLDEWKTTDLSKTETEGAPVPKKSSIAFDGTLTRQRPTDRATLFQHIDAKGLILATAYLQPADPLPAYESVPRQRNRLIGASIASGILSGTFYALSSKGQERFENPSAKASRKEILDLREEVNTYYTLSGIFGVLTVTGTIGAVTIGPR